jgi:hypothetical protein
MLPYVVSNIVKAYLYLNEVVTDVTFV